MASALEDLRAAIRHVEACTGNRDAWRAGLTSEDLAAVSATAVDPAAAVTLLAKVRANHPTLFDAHTGAPISPQTPSGRPAEVPGEQRGEAAAAIKKAEDQLAHQNSATATLDLHVIGAILNAHTVSSEGSERLRRLQREIEHAVASRTDLHTPTGARDFQRYLIDKLREIGAIVETANLDDTSKAALAGAWTALYEAGGRAPSAGPEESPGAGPEPAATAPTAPGAAVTPEALRPYGVDPGVLSDFGTDLGPLPDPLAVPPVAATPVMAAPASTPAPPLPMVPAGAAGPMLPMPASLPGLGGVAPARMDMPSGGESVSGPRLGSAPLDDEFLLGDLPEDYPSGDDPEVGNGEPEVAREPASASAPADSTTVQLPDGTTVRAPSQEIANVIRAVLDGSPIAAAFASEGISVPPPGSAVAAPVDAARVVAGDVAMFTDRQALAIDSDRALLEGRIQPVDAVGGPSFLGWLHPPPPGATTPTDSPRQPQQDPPPAPTRPASVTGSPR